MTRHKAVPTYRLHKSTNQAIVSLPNGFGGRKDFYLGPYGSPESRKEYLRLTPGVGNPRPTLAPMW